MKNAMQLKAIVKNVAKEKHISAQLVLQNYMMERLLERVAASKYNENFILKGGFLIASMVGLNSRATMDMDATIKGVSLSQEQVKEMFQEICAISLEDDMSFSFQSIGKIRKDDEYGGYRVAVTANYPPMAVPLKLDITTGDKITPTEILYQFPLLFEKRTISVLAYNLETIMAEKLEAILSRGNQSTRLRDYYDVYILTKMYGDKMVLHNLREAIIATLQKRDSEIIITEYRDIIRNVRESKQMQEQWKNYQKNFEYAKDISFDDACDTVIEGMNQVGKTEV